MWPELIAKAKHGGLNVIQTYVFWNVHEPEPGKVLLLLSSVTILQEIDHRKKKSFWHRNN